MHIPVPRERVFAALDSDAGRASFWAESAAEQDGVVTFEFVNGVRPSDEWAEVHAGWLNVLFPLKAWTTFGVDLRNHDPTRTWHEGYADQ